MWLAPMAGYTDAAFRAVCASQGAVLCFTEMVSADALVRDNALTRHMLEVSPEETRTGFQLFGSRPGIVGQAMRKIADLSPAVIDLNCGCSVPKVLKADCGAALMRSPDLVGSIVAAMKAETDRPVSVKLRLGWEDSRHTYLACAEAAVKAGASLVTLHPRSRAQAFRGTAHWEHIRTLKASCPVPVIGSGDLFTAQDCERMLRTTGCDGVMVARGSLGNPFIFRQAEVLLRGDDGGGCIEAELRLSTAMAHLRMLAGQVGEAKACRDMRKHFVAYTRGMEGGSVVRESVVHAECIQEYAEIVDSYLRQ
ncbi:MAG TPA: tRNA dihydrouridine synthase DusB [Spirochaetia bacterium]|nr:tRNA dihydrouridine synthase DusB [Spirochaetia bacterium]